MTFAKMVNSTRKVKVEKDKNRSAALIELKSIKTIVFVPRSFSKKDAFKEQPKIA